MKRAAALTLAIVLALGLGLTAEAKPRKRLIQNSVNVVDQEPPTFTGQITSEKRNCERSRPVELRFHGEGSDDIIVGTTTSESDGTWELTVTAKPANGIYQARIDRKKLKRKHGQKRTCKCASSPIFRLGPKPT